MLGLLLAATLTGCSGKDGKTSKPAEEQFKTKLDTQTECEITVVGHYNNFEALEAEFNRFTEYYPNVKMNYTFLDNYNGIIVTALTSDEAPDIFFTYPWMANQKEYQTVFDVAENLSDPALGINLSCHGLQQGKLHAVPVVLSLFLRIDPRRFEGHPGDERHEARRG